MPAERRLPEWLKVKMPGGRNYLELRQLVKDSNLNTVRKHLREYESLWTWNCL